MAQYKFTWDEEQKKPAPSGVKPSEVAGTAVRTSAGMLPQVIRLGTGIASGFPAAVPGLGTAVAGLVGGGGEAIAQMIENGSLDPSKLNLPRILAEGAISAIPFGKAVSIGRSVLKGAALAGAGVAGRKITSEDPKDRESITGWDLAQVALGGGIGAGAGKLAQSRAPHDPDAEFMKRIKGRYEKKPNETEFGPERVDDFLRTKRWDADRIATEASKMQSAGYGDAAQGLRVAARDTGAGNKGIYDDITRYQEKSTTQEARNLTTAEKFSQKRNEEYAKSENARARFQERVGKATKKEQIDREREAFKGWVQTAKNLDANTKAQMEKDAATLADSRLAELTAGGADVSRTARSQVKTTDPTTGESLTVTDTVRAAGEEGGGPGSASAAPRPMSRRPTSLESKGLAVMDASRAKHILGYDPEEAVRRGVLIQDGAGYRLNTKAGGKMQAASPMPVPKPGMFQVVDQSGMVKAELADEKDVLDIINAVGPTSGLRVINPSDYKPEAPAATKPPTPKREPKLKGRPSEILAKLEPEDTFKNAELNAAKSGTKALEDLEADTLAPIPRVPSGHGVLPAQEFPPPPGKDVIEATQQLPVKGPRSAITKLEALGYTTDDIKRMSAKQANEIITGGVRKGAPPVEPQATPATKKPSTTSPVAPAAPISAIPPKDVDPELLARLRIVDPTTGHTTYTPGISKPEGVVIQPNPRADGTSYATDGGYLRNEFGPKGSKIKDSAPNPQPRPGPDPLDLGLVKADLDNIQDPLVRVMAERELGIAPTPTTPRPTTETPPAFPSTAGPIISAPAKLPTGDIAPETGFRELDQVAGAIGKQKAEIASNPRLDDATKQSLIAELDEAAKAIDAKRLELLQKMDQGPSGGGGGFSASAMGALPTELLSRIVRENPEFSAQLLGTAGGGMAGAAIDEEDPLRGALLGAGAGFAGGRALGGMMGNTPMQLSRPGTPGLELAANSYRAGLLSDPINLSINTFLAPWGAGNMGAMEKMLAGINDPNQRATAAQALKNLWNPADQYSRFSGSLSESSRALHGDLERGGYLMGQAPTTYEKIIATPSSLMYAGDLTSRKALMEAGYNEDVARSMTLTANPHTQWGEGFVDFAKKHPAMTFLVPFSRTATNIVESGLERAPGVGVLYQLVRENLNSGQQQAWADVLAQQGLGAATYALGMLIGQNMDVETIRNNRLDRIIANMAGQYGAVATMGLAHGMANQSGRRPSDAVINAAINELPVPETTGISDAARSIARVGLEGEPAHPDALHAPERWLPKAAVPGALRDRSMLWQLMGMESTSPTGYSFKWDL